MRRAGRAFAALGICLAAACVGTGGFVLPSSRPGPYDVLPEPALERLAEARADWDAGERRIARARLLTLASEHPRNVPVAILLQELELETLAEGGELSDLGLYAADDDWEDELRRLYRERAEATPTPERLVLAARLETDFPAARALLERALQADPQCAWTHYALAHQAFLRGDFAAGNAALAEALALDPGNLAVRRLQTRALARSSRPATAADALEQWIRAATGDLFVRRRELAEARFDLALLEAEAGESERVEDLCGELLEEDLVDRGSVYLILAAARIARDDAEGALEAARRASRLAPDDALGHVQRALLLEGWQARPERAYEAWARALEVARGTTTAGLEESGRPRPGTVRDARLWLQARTRMERLERAGSVESEALVP